MGIRQSTENSLNNNINNAPPPAAPAARPASSPLGSHPPGILSLFLPVTPRLLTHDHTPPTLDDINLVISYFLLLGIPPEIAMRILDKAEYWAQCRRESRKEMAVRSTQNRGYVDRGVPWTTGQEEEVPRTALEQDGGLSNKNGEIWYMVSSPIGCYTDPDEEDVADFDDSPGGDYDGSCSRERGRSAWARRVIIETFSKDQGWSNFRQCYGTYDQSYSWFQVALLRGDREVPGSRVDVQHNVHAGQYYKAHSNTLTTGHPVLRLAQDGDRIVLWARALYPGWANCVREAAITVYTSPFPPQT